jgi:hypothetical protein
VHIGDRLKQIGSVVLVVGQSRMPSYKLDLKFNGQDMIRRFAASGRALSPSLSHAFTSERLALANSGFSRSLPNIGSSSGCICADSTEFFADQPCYSLGCGLPQRTERTMR